MFGLSRLRQLQAENDALREALAYYADVRRRAQLATLAAASATNARSHIEQALLNAEHGRLNLAVLNDLRACINSLVRTTVHAEQCRRRLLRKADRLADPSTKQG